MKKLCVLAVCVLFCFIGCNGGGGGGGSEDKDPCAGPVLCLDTDWGDQGALFYDNALNPVALLSDGEFFGVAGYVEIDGELELVGAGGNVIDCYEGYITVAGIDYNRDGVVDYWFTSASGLLEVCAETLKVSGIVIEGELVEDISATYDGMVSLSASNHLSTDAPIHGQCIDDVKASMKLIKQLME